MDGPNQVYTQTHTNGESRKTRSDSPPFGFAFLFSSLGKFSNITKGRPAEPARRQNRNGTNVGKPGPSCSLVSFRRKGEIHPISRTVLRNENQQGSQVLSGDSSWPYHSSVSSGRARAVKPGREGGALLGLIEQSRGPLSPKSFSSCVLC